MGQPVRNIVLIVVSISALAACSDPAKSLAEAQPAAGSQLHEFSRQWNDKVDLAKATPLLQRYCMNASGAPCAPDTIEKLRQYGFSDGATGVDLAEAFVRMTADAKDGVVDQKVSDSDFVAACYHVMFGREPDAGGAAHHLSTISGKGEEARKGLAMAFLRSPEFSSQK